MQTPLKVVSNYPNRAYSELPQLYSCLFAFAKIEDDKVHVLHKPVKCRDFLLDTLLWESGYAPLPKEIDWDGDTDEPIETDEPGNIYGYDFTGPIEKEQSVMYVEYLPHAQSNLKFLNDFEVACGMEPSVLVPTTEDQSYVVIGDAEWMKTTVLFSMYTWCIRNFLFPKVPNTMTEQHPESNVLEIYPKIISLPREHKGLLPREEYKAWNGEDYHASNGFMTYLCSAKGTVYE